MIIFLALFDSGTVLQRAINSNNKKASQQDIANSLY